MTVSRRHPAEVTSDRLGDAAVRWHPLMTGSERDALATVRFVLEEIADGTRTAGAAPAAPRSNG